MGRRRHNKKSSSSSSSSSSGCQKACNNDNGCQSNNQSNNQTAQSCPPPQQSCSYYDQLCGMMQSGMNCFEAQTPMKKAAICAAALWSCCKLYKHHEKKKCERKLFKELFDYCCADVCGNADDCDSDSSKWCHCDSESKSDNCSESSMSESCKKPKRENCKKNINNN